MIGAPAAGTANIAWNRSLMRRIAETPNIEYLGQLNLDRKLQRLAGARLCTRQHKSVRRLLKHFHTGLAARGACQLSPVLPQTDGILDRETVGLHAGSESALAQMVRRLIEDRTFRDRLARGAASHARKFHSMDNARRLEEDHLTRHSRPLNPAREPPLWVVRVDSMQELRSVNNYFFFRSGGARIPPEHKSTFRAAKFRT